MRAAASGSKTKKTAKCSQQISDDKRQQQFKWQRNCQLNESDKSDQHPVSQTVNLLPSPPCHPLGVPPLGHNVKSAVEKRARAKSNDCQCENKSHSFILAACQTPFPAPVPGTFSILLLTPFLPPLCCAPRTTAAIKTLVQHR